MITKPKTGLAKWGLATWALAVATAIAGLHAAGSALPPPPSSPSAWRAWVSSTDPVVAGFGVLRLLALAGAWYLALVTAASLVARLLRIRPAVRVTDAVTVAPLRRLLHASLGMTLTVGSFAPAAGAGAPGNEVAVVRRLPGLSETAAVTRVVPLGTPATPSPEPTAARLTPTPSSVAAAGPVAARPDQPSTWRVKPGDHLWSVAERTLARARATRPDDADVAAYWRTVIERNRDRLVDPGNPDLLFPGQLLVLPAVPGRP